jgi:hypothetical protein
MTSANEKSETDKTLKEFGKCCLALCDVLHSDRQLDEMELLFIDNHLQVLHGLSPMEEEAETRLGAKP